MPARTNLLKEQHHPTFIRAWREYRGLSQDRLVERVREVATGFSKATLSRLENGKQQYTQPLLEALAAALQCDPADLISRDPRIDDAVAELTRLLREASKSDQHTALRIVRGFIANGTDPQ